MPNAQRAAAGRPIRIDFDGIQQRIIAVPDLALRDYAQLRAGAPGTVFFLEPIPATGTGDRPGGGGRRWRRHAASLSAQHAPRDAVRAGRGAVRRERRRHASCSIARRWWWRTGRRRRAGRRQRRRAVPRRRRSSGTDRPGTGRLTAQLRAYIDPEGRVPADLQRGMAQRAQQPLREEPARHRLAEDEADVRASCCRT